MSGDPLLSPSSKPRGKPRRIPLTENTHGTMLLEALLAPAVLCLCGSAHGLGALVPRYSAAPPNYQKPNAGLPLVSNAEHILIFNATPTTGT